MFGCLRLCSILVLALAFAYVDPAQAEPSIDEVYRQAHAGHLAKAQEMMQAVLRDHPDSAKAHYVMADLLAASGERAQAAEHLATARRLQPGLPFAKPESVRELEQRLNAGEGEGEGERDDAAVRTKPLLSFGWGSAIALFVGLSVVALIFRRRPEPAAGSMPSSGALAAAPAAGPAGATPAAPTSGTGIGSALATGLAAGAGVVAGEALAERLLSPDEQTTARPPEAAPAPADDDLGGDDFGISDPSFWDGPDSDDADDPANGDGWG